MSNDLHSNGKVHIGRRKFLKGALVSAVAVTAAGPATPGQLFAAPTDLAKRALYSPAGIAFSNDNKLYVADSGNYNVHEFDANGKLLRSFGAPGAGKGELNFPTDVAVYADRLYAIDTNNGRIVVFDRTTGAFIRNIGSLGGSADRLFTPQGIFVDGNKAFVANTRSHNCQIWDLALGKVVSVIGIFGDESSVPKKGDADLRFRLPTAIVADPKTGAIFIADSKHRRIVYTDATGGFIAQFDAKATGKKLSEPTDLAFYNDEIYVADSGNKRIVRIHTKTGVPRVLSGTWANPVGVDIREGVLAISDAPDKVMTIKIPG
jgi:DNA-binding beta-propeller fold protein YncE